MTDDDSSTAADDSGALIKVQTIHNLRDVGGLSVQTGGRMRSGSVFRSAQLGERNDTTMAQLEELGLDAVFDLRSDHEVSLLPDFVPDGVRLQQVDVLADSDERIAAQLEDLFTDPAGAAELLRSGAVQDHYSSTYRHLVSLPSAKSSYRALFSSLAEGQSVLFHCTAGKDRTGWAAASLQLLLGVALDDVFDHYLASNSETLELFGGILRAFEDAGGDTSALKPVFMVEAMYLESAIDEMTRSFGTIGGYFSNGLGLSTLQVAALKESLTE
ncbi:MAG: tyrosine-protein phosphatase [Microthrixaceae bacterium]